MSNIRVCWRNNKIFEKSLELSSDRPLYTFNEGPPTANGRPGIHHVLARAFKDVYPRYKTMQGFHVPRKAGWDTHGLPVEHEIEKELGIIAKINFKTLQPGDAIETFSDNDKSIKELNYNPSISIREGLIKFINWYKKYYIIN